MEQKPLKFSVVVVLYKKSYCDSPSLNSFIGALGEMRAAGFFPTIYVWNNSPGFSPILEHEAVVWLEGENSSLPSIYNHIAKLTFEAGGVALMISDDDTDYSQYDFRGNLKVVRSFLDDERRMDMVGCFIPKVRSAGKLVSPGGRHLFKGYLLEQITSGLVDTKNLLAINSGVLITQACYERMQPLYDERLNFYGTDTDFFFRYEKFFKKIYVFDSLVDHSLSEYAGESLSRALFRWGDHIYAMKVTFSGEGFLCRLALSLYIFYLKIKLSFKYKALSFVFLK
ncbi:hypothetical protein E0E52_18560 [Azotobacter chroococcum]|uniref:hypothetical protein n=1 Tax=Azotobacter chroococcum TaxID=353 RepID=UPI00103FA730|nr:hypothetical protein [Azotobacter chroococcum]TBW02233.1 hypothetical protein E0E52_18560 [Azotobacter chroococcum]